jgi:SEC-C motif-containing protein/YcxB-like protein
VSNDVFLKFEYGARDVIDVARLRALQRLRAHPALVLGGLAGIGAAAFVCVIAPVWVRHLAAWLAALGAVHLVFSVLKTVPYAMFRRSSEDQRKPMEARGDFWDRKMSVDASEDGIVVTVGRRSATIKWRECVRLESNARSYLIRLGETGFLAVPRRAFRTAKKDAAFRELATRLVGVAGEVPLSESLDGAPPHLEPPLDEPSDRSDDESTPAPLLESATRTPAPKVGRNDPCPCGSGKKYKKCCLHSPTNVAANSPADDGRLERLRR